MIAGDLDKGEALEQLDHSDRSTGDAGLICDRSHNISGTYAIIAPDIDVEPGHTRIGTELVLVPSSSWPIAFTYERLLLGQLILGLILRLTQQQLECRRCQIRRAILFGQILRDNRVRLQVA